MTGLDLDEMAELERAILAEFVDMQYAALVLDRFMG